MLENYNFESKNTFLNSSLYGSYRLELTDYDNFYCQHLKCND